MLDILYLMNIFLIIASKASQKEVFNPARGIALSVLKNIAR